MMYEVITDDEKKLTNCTTNELILVIGIHI